MPTTGSSNGLGYCIVFLDESLYHDCSSSQPVVLLTSKFYHKLKLLGGYGFLWLVFFLVVVVFAIDLHLNAS